MACDALHKQWHRSHVGDSRGPVRQQGKRSDSACPNLDDRQETGDQGREEEKDEGVDAEGCKGDRPSPPLPDLDEPVADRQDHQGEAGREHHVRARPQRLVDRKPEAPDLADGDAEDPGHGEACRDHVGPAPAAQPSSGENAQQRRGHGRDGAQDPFGVVDLRELPDMLSEDRAIEVRRQVSLGAEIAGAVTRNRHHGHHEPVPE